MLDLFSRLWLQLTEPLVPISDPHRRQHSRVIATFALIVLIMATISVTASVLNVHNGFPPELVSLWLALAAFLVPYWLARRGRPQPAVLLHGINAVANLFISAWLLPDAESKLNVLAYLSLVGLYVTAFLPFSAAVLFVSAYVILTPVFVIGVLGIPVTIFDEPLLFNIIAAFCSIVMVTYWRQREAAQRLEVVKSEQRYRVISEMTSDYMFFVLYGAEGKRKLEWVTESVERFSGYSMAEVLIQTDASVYTDDRALVLENRKKTLAGEAVTGDYRFIRKDGHLRWVQVHTRPAWDQQGTRVIGYYGAVRDITDRKQAEERETQLLLRREQFTIVEHFIAAMSHDFRNRLATIESSRHLLQRMVDVATEGALKDRMAPRMQTIQDSISQMLVQLDNISIVARLSHVQLAQVDLKPTLEGLHAQLEPNALAAGVQLRLQQDAALSCLRVDPVQFESALHHLIVNAIAHSDAGDTVTLRTRQEGEHTVLEVSDEGSGISTEEIQHIFEPFYKVGTARTISRSGVGLGLTIVKLIVDAHGGRIEVDSKIGEGSTFRLLFPAQRTP